MDAQSKPKNELVISTRKVRPRRKTVSLPRKAPVRASGRSKSRKTNSVKPKRSRSLASGDVGRKVVKAIRQSSSGSGVASAVARSLMLPSPDLTTPYRFSGNMTNAEPSACLGVDEEILVSFPVAPVVLPVGETVAFQFRDALRNRIVFKDNVSNATQSYDGQFTDSLPFVTTGEPAGPSFTINEDADPVFDEKGRVPFPLQFLTSNPEAADWSPHGPILYAGHHKQSAGRFFWMDADAVHVSTVTITFEPPLSSLQTFSVSVDRYSGGNLEQAAFSETYTGDSAKNRSKSPSRLSSLVELSKGSNSNTKKPKKTYFTSKRNVDDEVTSITFNTVIPAYHAFFWSYAGEVAQTVTLNYANDGSPSMAHLPLPDFATHQADVEGFRTLGSALHFQNTAADNYKNGSAYALQSPKTTPWTTWAYGGVATLTKARQEEDLLAANGVYAFLRPSEASDLSAFHTPVVFALNQLIPSECDFDIEPDSGYLVIYVKVPDPLGQAGTWKSSMSFEFLTSSKWYDVRLPNMAPSEYEKALTILAYSPQIYENPTHLRDIIAAVRKGAKVADNLITRYGPHVAKILSLMQ